MKRMQRLQLPSLISKSVTVFTTIVLFLTAGAVFVVAEGAQEEQAQGGPALINWDSPDFAERLTADEYILPDGWEEATAGVDEIVVGNAGGMSHDIATYINMKRFEEITGIKVTPLETPENIADNKALTVFTTQDKSVDTPFVRHKYALSTYAASNFLEPLDVLWPQKVRELYGTTRYLKYKDHYYGVPNTVNMSTEFYRPSWFQKAGVGEVPDNWEDLYDALKQVQSWARENVGEETYGIVFSGKQVMDPLASLVHSQGAYIYDGEKYTFGSEEFRNAFEYLVRLVREDLASPETTNFMFNDAGRFLGLGKAAFGIGFRNSYQMKYMTEFPQVEGDWAMTAPLKWSADDPVEYRSTYFSGGGSVVPTYLDPNHKAALMLYLDFIRSKEARTVEVVVEGNESALVAVYEDPNLAQKVDWEAVEQAAEELNIPAPPRVDSVPNKDVRREAAKYVRAESYPAGFVQIRAKIQEEWVKAATEQVSVDEALETIQAFAAQLQ